METQALSTISKPLLHSDTLQLPPLQDLEEDKRQRQPSFPLSILESPLTLCRWGSCNGSCTCRSSGRQSRHHGTSCHRRPLEEYTSQQPDKRGREAKQLTVESVVARGSTADSAVAGDSRAVAVVRRALGTDTAAV